MITSESGPFALVPIWLLAKGLKPASVLTYIALASFANAETGKAHPKQQQIADRAGLKLDTVNKALGELDAAEIVERKKWFTTSGDIGGCHYRIRVVDPNPQVDTTGVPDADPVGVPDENPVPPRQPSGTYRTSVRNKKQTNKQTNEQTKPSSHAASATCPEDEEIIDAEIIDDELPLNVPTPPSADNTTPVQLLVGAYSDAITSDGGVMTKQTASIIGRAIKRLLTVDKLDPGVVFLAVQLAGGKRSKDVDRFLGTAKTEFTRSGPVGDAKRKLWAEKYGATMTEGH